MDCINKSNLLGAKIGTRRASGARESFGHSKGRNLQENLQQILRLFLARLASCEIFLKPKLVGVNPAANHWVFNGKSL
jgi:hypothetical protein